MHEFQYDVDYNFNIDHNNQISFHKTFSKTHKDQQWGKTEENKEESEDLSLPFMQLYS